VAVKKNRALITLRSVYELLRFPTTRAIQFNSSRWRIQRFIKRSGADAIASVRIGLMLSQETHWRG